MYKKKKSLIDCHILQDDLNSLAQWETDWQMNINVVKYHSMRVTRHLRENQIQFEYSLHQQRLEHVQSAKYLGITITDNLDCGRVGKILTARDFPCGKSRDFPGWEIPSNFENLDILGNKNSYKKIYYIYIFFFKEYF